MDLLCEMLRESLRKANITQAGIAKVIRTSQQNVSDYICGKRMIPADQVVAWAIETRSPEILYEWERAMGLREDGHLNNVSLEPLHVAAKWLEETREAAETLKELLPKLVNRTAPEHFNCDKLRDEIYRTLEEVYDSEKVSRYLRISFTKVGFDPREVERRNEAKIKARGYRVKYKKAVPLAR